MNLPFAQAVEVGRCVDGIQAFLQPPTAIPAAIGGFLFRHAAARGFDPL
jgi:hypothetical protein